MGHFAFAAGVLAKVISTPSTSFRGKYWVADAFRFTRVSDSCSAVPYSALLTLRIVGAELPVEEDLVGLTSYGDLRLAFIGLQRPQKVKRINCELVPLISVGLPSLETEAARPACQLVRIIGATCARRIAASTTSAQIQDGIARGARVLI